MNRQNKKQVIQELANEAFTFYPEFYETEAQAKEWARIVWDNRNEDEIEGDDAMCLALGDYMLWATLQFNEWKQMPSE